MQNTVELKKDNGGKNKYLVALPCFPNAKGFSHQTILLYARNIDDARCLAKILKPRSNIGDIKKVDY
jgi:hypothetical protein